MGKCKLCEKDSLYQGYCNAHYRQGRRNGTIQLVLHKNEGPCSIEGCENKQFAKGICEKHYRQTQRKENFKRCSVEGCGEAHIANGFCNKHYQRFVSTGSTDDPIVIEKCTVEGCDKEHFALGYCSKHYRRNALYGNPETMKRPKNVRECLSCGEEKSIHGKGLCRSCYRKDNQHNRRVYEHNRRVKIRKGTTGRYTKQQVLDKTNGFCGICGGPIDLTLKAPHKDSFSIDHIVPISRGGANTLDNVQAAHLLCNCSKQAKL